jgi:hypothetical protein
MASPGGDPLNPATHTGNSHTGSGTEAAKENAEHLTERVKDRAAGLKRKAEDTVQDMGARARSAADEQKNMAAERVGGVARALRVESREVSTTRSKVSRTLPGTGRSRSWAAPWSRASRSLAS